MFDGVADALRVPNSDIRLFGKPESFVKRRMGVALAFHADVEAARVNAKKAAGMVKPRVVCLATLEMCERPLGASCRQSRMAGNWKLKYVYENG